MGDWGLSVQDEKDDNHFHYWSVLVGWSGKKMVIAISYSYVDFGAVLAPIPSFNPMGHEKQKLKIFVCGWSGW